MEKIPFHIGISIPVDLIVAFFFFFFFRKILFS
jgi:hypothetical protein